MHSALHDVIRRLEAAELHAARAGREVMSALARVAAESSASSAVELADEIEAAIDALLAVMPAYAPPLNVMHRIMVQVEEGLNSGMVVNDLKAVLVGQDEHYQRWSDEARAKLARYGGQLIADGATLFTFTLSETVMRTLQQAHQEGKRLKVLVTESRPNCDGLTTAALLSRAGIPVAISLDACMGELVPQADMMLIGAEAVMADGSVIAKVGTYPAALLAKAHGVPVLVAADTMKFNASSALGLSLWLAPIAGADVRPAGVAGRAQIAGHLFDRTPAELIAGVITELGVLSPAECSAAIRKMPLSKTMADKLVGWGRCPSRN